MDESLVTSALLASVLGDDSSDVSVGELAHAILQNQPGSCWGGQLTGSDWRCDKTFAICGPHFKDKLCPRCQSLGIRVSANRVRMLAPGARSNLVNGNGGGVWTKLSSRAVVGDKRDRKQLQNETVFFRIVNHTARCESPRIVIFEGLPLEREWIPLPPSWISESDQTVHLLIRKGTLVPAASDHLQMACLMHQMPQLASLLPSPVQPPHRFHPFMQFAAPLASPSPHLVVGCGVGSLDHPRQLEQMGRGGAGLLPLGQEESMPPMPPAPTAAQPMYLSPPPMGISPPTMLAPSACLGGIASGWTSRTPFPPAILSQPDSMPARRPMPSPQRALCAAIPASFQGMLGLPGLGELEIPVLYHPLQPEPFSRALAARSARNEDASQVLQPWISPLMDLGVDLLWPNGVPRNA